MIDEEMTKKAVIHYMYSRNNIIDEIIPYGCIIAGDWEIDAPWRKRKG